MANQNPSPATRYRKGAPGTPSGRQGAATGIKEMRLQAEMARKKFGLTPLRYLLCVMNNIDPDTAKTGSSARDWKPPRTPDGKLLSYPLTVRMEAARTAAPYIHKKMPVAVELDKALTALPAEKLAQLADEEIEMLLGLLEKVGLEVLPLTDEPDA